MTHILHRAQMPRYPSRWGARHRTVRPQRRELHRRIRRCGGILSWSQPPRRSCGFCTSNSMRLPMPIRFFTTEIAEKLADRLIEPPSRNRPRLPGERDRRRSRPRSKWRVSISWRRASHSGGTLSRGVRAITAIPGGAGNAATNGARAIPPSVNRKPIISTLYAYRLQDAARATRLTRRARKCAETRFSNSFRQVIAFRGETVVGATSGACRGRDYFKRIARFATATRAADPRRSDVRHGSHRDVAACEQDGNCADLMAIAKGSAAAISRLGRLASSRFSSFSKGSGFSSTAITIWATRWPPLRLAVQDVIRRTGCWPTSSHGRLPAARWRNGFPTTYVATSAARLFRGSNWSRLRLQGAFAPR